MKDKTIRKPLCANHIGITRSGFKLVLPPECVYCINAKKAYKEKYENNKEWYSLISKKYREANREKIKERDRKRPGKYYANNKEKYRLRAKQYYENNRERILKYQKEYKQKNKPLAIKHRTVRKLQPVIKKERVCRPLCKNHVGLRKKYFKIVPALECNYCIKHKIYRKNNSNKIRERHFLWRKNNRDRIRERYKKYYANNKEYYKKYYANNKDRIEERRKQYVANNRDKILKYHKEYNRKIKNALNTP